VSTTITCSRTFPGDAVCARSPSTHAHERHRGSYRCNPPHPIHRFIFPKSNRMTPPRRSVARSLWLHTRGLCTPGLLEILAPSRPVCTHVSTPANWRAAPDSAHNGGSRPIAYAECNPRGRFLWQARSMISRNFARK
jgi:hypothetical protein